MPKSQISNPEFKSDLAVYKSFLSSHSKLLSQMQLSTSVPPTPLKNKVVLITEGVNDLGGLTAQRFAAEGASLALHHNTESSAHDAQSILCALAPSDVAVRVYQANLTTALAVEVLFQDILCDFGRIDVVINTVEAVVEKPLLEITEQEYDNLFAMNSKVAFFVSQQAARNVSEGGRIINTIANLSAPYSSQYAGFQGSMASIEHITKGLSEELSSRSITVNAVALSPREDRSFYDKRLKKSIKDPQKIAQRLTSSEDIVHLFLFLCIDGALVSGQTLFADGSHAGS